MPKFHALDDRADRVRRWRFARDLGMSENSASGNNENVPAASSHDSDIARAIEDTCIEIKNTRTFLEYLGHSEEKSRRYTEVILEQLQQKLQWLKSMRAAGEE
jgi:hypothetical protein